MTAWHDSFGDDPDNDDDDRDPVLSTGDMTHGDSFTVEVRAEPETTDTEHGDALRVECSFLGSSGHDFETEDGEPFNEGDDVVLLTWSKRLGRALHRVARKRDEADDDGNPSLAGATVEVTKLQPDEDDQYSVTYDAVLVDPDN